MTIFHSWTSSILFSHDTLSAIGKTSLHNKIRFLMGSCYFLQKLLPVMEICLHLPVAGGIPQSFYFHSPNKILITSPYKVNNFQVSLVFVRYLPCFHCFPSASLRTDKTVLCLCVYLPSVRATEH